MIEENLDTTKFFSSIRVESHVKFVRRRNQFDVRRREFRTAHSASVRVPCQPVDLRVVVHTLVRPLDLVCLEGHEDPRTGRTCDSELAMVVRWVERGVVGGIVGSERLVVCEPDIGTVGVRWWGCSCPENSTETEILAGGRGIAGTAMYNFRTA